MPRPVTTLAADPEREAKALADALNQVEATYLISLPNTDPGHESVRPVMMEAGTDTSAANAIIDQPSAQSTMRNVTR